MVIVSHDPEPIPQLRNAIASNNLRIFISSFLCSHLADVYVSANARFAPRVVTGQVSTHDFFHDLVGTAVDALHVIATL